MRTIQGRHGVLELEQLSDKIRPLDDHFVRTKLVCLENTHNRGGGTIQPLENVDAICSWAHENGIATHMDGARLFNAEAATGITAKRWSQGFDSVSVCFSKGLGAPVGSALAGLARVHSTRSSARKLFGGAMRQVGILAAGALFAIQHNRQRLTEDHENAKLLAQAIDQAHGLNSEPVPETNIVVARIDPALGNSQSLCKELAAVGVLGLPFGPHHIRFVTHLDVNRQQVEQAGEVLIRLTQTVRA